MPPLCGGSLVCQSSTGDVRDLFCIRVSGRGGRSLDYGQMKGGQDANQYVQMATIITGGPSGSGMDDTFQVARAWRNALRDRFETARWERSFGGRLVTETLEVHQSEAEAVMQFIGSADLDRDLPPVEGGPRQVPGSNQGKGFQDTVAVPAKTSSSPPFSAAEFRRAMVPFNSFVCFHYGSEHMGGYPAERFFDPRRGDGMNPTGHVWRFEWKVTNHDGWKDEVPAWCWVPLDSRNLNAPMVIKLLGGASPPPPRGGRADWSEWRGHVHGQNPPEW